MHGHSSWYSESFDKISLTSSNVPVAPGKAMKASPSSIILVLRSAISFSMYNLVRLSMWTPSSTNICASTPITLPPAFNVLLASSPINPVLDPPNTNV